MSKEISLNYQALKDLLFDGTGSKEDTQIYYMIEHLKNASLTCSELCVTVEYETPQATRERLAEINRTLAETWRTLEEVQTIVYNSK